MAKRIDVPERFAKTGKSFVNTIKSDAYANSMRSFAAFPKNISFNGKDEKEEIILLVRKSPASFITQYLTILGFLVAPFVFFSLLNLLGLSGREVTSIGAGATLMFILLAAGIAVDTFLKWFYSVNIITDERIVDVDFSNVLYHRFSETQLEQIQDVTHTVNGLLGSLFDYGSVYVQTAGSKPEFEFINVPRPRDIQDVLLDLLEMKQKGEL